jgi:hypothetical protein
MLSAAGYRSNLAGAFYNRGAYGYYWSGSPVSTFAYALFFFSTSVIPAVSNYRAYGFSVRCLKN